MKEKISQSHKLIHYLENELLNVKKSNASSIDFPLPKHLQFAEHYIYKSMSDLNFADWLDTLDRFGIFYYLSVETRYVWYRSNHHESDVLSQLLDLRLGKKLFTNRKLNTLKTKRTMCLPFAVSHWRFKDLAQNLAELFEKIPEQHHDRFFEVLPEYVWHWAANIDYPEWDGIDKNLDEFLITEKELRLDECCSKSGSSMFTKPNLTYFLLSSSMFESALYVAGTDARCYKEEELIDKAKEFVLDFMTRERAARDKGERLTFYAKEFPLYIDRTTQAHSRSIFFIKDLKEFNKPHVIGQSVLPFNTKIPAKYSNYLWIDFNSRGCIFGQVKDLFELKKGSELENNPNVAIWLTEEPVYEISIN